MHFHDWTTRNGSPLTKGTYPPYFFLTFQNLFPDKLTLYQQKCLKFPRDFHMNYICIGFLFQETPGGNMFNYSCRRDEVPGNGCDYYNYKYSRTSCKVHYCNTEDFIFTHDQDTCTSLCCQ